MKSIYLDYAAATPVDPRVLAAMQPYFTEKFYNPSALYLAAKDVARDVADARARVAKHLGARPGEIVFTAGGTEANNLAIHGVLQQHIFKEDGPLTGRENANVVVSAVEHESVLKPAHQYDCREVGVDAQGFVDLRQLVRAIDDQTVLVSIVYANNEIGTVQHMATISKRLWEIRQERIKQGNLTPLYFHTDACQAPNYLPLFVDRIGKVDLMTINGGKIYGPKQSGALYVRAGVKLAPQILGGGQEQGLRSGTENVAHAVGLSIALEQAQAARKEEARRLTDLQKLFYELVAQELPQARVNGTRFGLPNNVHITIPGADNERLIMALDEAGIQAAAGSACSASSEEPSHVLRALGMTDAEAQASLRFTMGRGTDEAAVQKTITELAKICNEPSSL
jgi:cysteine desulfurase